ncbi:MAG: hypothetical protein ACE5PV_16635 [Candidatus Poribacteria bacterium]
MYRTGGKRARNVLTDPAEIQVLKQLEYQRYSVIAIGDEYVRKLLNLRGEGVKSPDFVAVKNLKLHFAEVKTEISISSTGLKQLVHAVNRVGFNVVGSSTIIHVGRNTPRLRSNLFINLNGFLNQRQGVNTFDYSPYCIRLQHLKI